ncbi:MAG: hypothetical protein KDE58_16205, partial [Caldilineaceae bacterium]|nr:hypothetical protein [Caldilineaceae bacterium]
MSAERHIPLPQDGVAGNISNQPVPKRARNTKFAHCSWGQLQWMFGGGYAANTEKTDLKTGYAGASKAESWI